MSDDNVRFLRTDCITPAAVVRNVAEHIRDNPTKAVYILVIDADDTVAAWASGDLGHMCTASKYLDMLTHRYLRGELIPEE